MKLTERYLSVIDVLGGRATIKQIQDAMSEMRWVGFSHSSIYIVFKRLRAKGQNEAYERWLLCHRTMD